MYPSDDPAMRLCRTPFTDRRGSLHTFAGLIERDKHRHHTDLHLEVDGAVNALDDKWLGDLVDDGVGGKDALELVEDLFRLFLACVLHAEGKAQHPRLG